MKMLICNECIFYEHILWCYCMWTYILLSPIWSKFQQLLVLGENAEEALNLRNVFIVNSRDGMPPCTQRKQHRREMQESAKANGRLPLPHIPVSYSWSVPFCLYKAPSFQLSVSASFSLHLHHWRCAYLSCAVSQGLWWRVRIASAERESCLNAAWCILKLRALKPGRHESSPLTAWCLLFLQLRQSLGTKNPGPN